MRMSTSLLALWGQSGTEETLETPTRARSRSSGSRSERMSPLAIARSTRERIAPLILVPEDSNSFEGPPTSVFSAGAKTANILFAVAFDQRHRARGIRGTAVHPGGIQTELGRHLDHSHVQSMIERMNTLLAAEGKPPFQ